MPAGASSFYARNITALLLHLIKDGALNLDMTDEITVATVISKDGAVVQPATAKLLGIEPVAPPVAAAPAALVEAPTVPPAQVVVMESEAEVMAKVIEEVDEAPLAAEVETSIPETPLAEPAETPLAEPAETPLTNEPESPTTGGAA